MGYNYFGQLISDDFEQDCACGEDFTLLVDADGWLWGCGGNESGHLGKEIPYTETFRLLPLKTRVKSVVCSNHKSLILDEYSDVYLMTKNTIKK